jgi:hypothetical protein
VFTGTRPADESGVQRRRDLLSIRAILVGTRAAVRSHGATGRPDLIRTTAERGLALMDELSAELGPDADKGVLNAAAEARAEIAGIVENATEDAQVTPRG